MNGSFHNVERKLIKVTPACQIFPSKSLLHLLYHFAWVVVRKQCNTLNLSLESVRFWRSPICLLWFQ